MPHSLPSAHTLAYVQNWWFLLQLILEAGVKISCNISDSLQVILLPCEDHFRCMLKPYKQRGNKIKTYYMFHVTYCPSPATLLAHLFHPLGSCTTIEPHRCSGVLSSNQATNGAVAVVVVLPRLVVADGLKNTPARKSVF